MRKQEQGMSILLILSLLAVVGGAATVVMNYSTNSQQLAKDRFMDSYLDSIVEQISQETFNITDCNQLYAATSPVTSVSPNSPFRVNATFQNNSITLVSLNLDKAKNDLTVQFRPNNPGSQRKSYYKTIHLLAGSSTFCDPQLLSAHISPNLTNTKTYSTFTSKLDSINKTLTKQTSNIDSPKNNGKTTVTSFVVDSARSLDINLDQKEGPK